MPFITSVERIGIEKGRKIGLEEGRVEGRVEGLIQAITLGVELKFPGRATELLPQVNALNKAEALEAALQSIRTCRSADEFQTFLQQSGAGACA